VDVDVDLDGRAAAVESPAFPCKFRRDDTATGRADSGRRGARNEDRRNRTDTCNSMKLAFHDADTDTDTDMLERILAGVSDTRDFLKLFLWQAERHADILATILAMMSVSVSASWNGSIITRRSSDTSPLPHLIPEILSQTNRRVTKRHTGTEN